MYPCLFYYLLEKGKTLYKQEKEKFKMTQQEYYNAVERLEELLAIAEAKVFYNIDLEGAGADAN